ncbi:hypothetical protein AB4393_18525 [Vibrio splendidus]|uniref:Uncharacterized protein n=1 Tax=Vibrio lentus TaxID=136468 RepID=A0A4U2F0N0_9VIBR|nr:hypothetical protein FCV91_14325 [Vibrio lentus]
MSPNKRYVQGEKLKLLVKAIIYVSVTFAVVAMVCVLAVYFYMFNGNLSANSSDWANFGSYVGGLTTPVLSFCALVALLASLRVQQIEFNSLSESQAIQLEVATQSHEATLINNHKQTLLRFLEQFITSHQIMIQQNQLIIQEQRQKQSQESPFYSPNQGQDAYSKINESIGYIRLATTLSFELTLQEFNSVDLLNSFFASKVTELKLDLQTTED